MSKGVRQSICHRINQFFLLTLSVVSGGGRHRAGGAALKLAELSAADPDIYRKIDEQEKQIDSICFFFSRHRLAFFVFPGRV